MAGIADIEGVVEVVDETADEATQEVEIGRAEELSLNPYEGIGAEGLEEPQTSGCPRGDREEIQLEAPMAQGRAELAQTVADAGVLEIVDEKGDAR